MLMGLQLNLTSHRLTVDMFTQASFGWLILVGDFLDGLRCQESFYNDKKAGLKFPTMFI